MEIIGLRVIAHIDGWLIIHHIEIWICELFRVMEVLPSFKNLDTSCVKRPGQIHMTVACFLFCRITLKTFFYIVRTNHHR